MRSPSLSTFLSEYETRFIYSIKLERLYMQALSTTFFQSFLLSVIAYFTLYINIVDFTNRFMGALTSLLVLAALLSSINSSLPQTAYFKHINFWFWYICSFLYEQDTQMKFRVIVIYHVGHTLTFSYSI